LFDIVIDRAPLAGQYLLMLQPEVMMGSGQFFLAQDWSGQPSLLWVWVRKFYPKNNKFLIFSPLCQKNLFGLGQKVPGSKGVGLLFTTGQKYAQVRLGHGSSLTQSGRWSYWSSNLQPSDPQGMLARHLGHGYSLNLPFK